MFEVKEELTIDNVLSKISDIDLFKTYCTTFKEIGKHFNSELRKDPVPSCMISYYNGRLWYKDFGDTGKACTIEGYIQRKYGLSYLESLDKINNDFGLGLKSYKNPSSKKYEIPIYTELDKSIIDNDDKIITINKREWLPHDIEFWYGRYYLTLKILKFYKIYPITSFTINGKKIKTDLHTYAFLIDVENSVERYKIYSPFNKVFKWISNTKAHHYQGYNQLPWIYDKLIITKSLKDVAVLSLFKIPSIAPQSESQLIQEDFMKGLFKRFNKIYMFFDNDKTGIEGSKKNAELFNIEERFIPIESGVKDVSDYIRKYGYKSTKKLVKQLF